jgi:hypothetical protein
LNFKIGRKKGKGNIFFEIESRCCRKGVERWNLSLMEKKIGAGRFLGRAQLLSENMYREDYRGEEKDSSKYV